MYKYIYIQIYILANILAFKFFYFLISVLAPKYYFTLMLGRDSDLSSLLVLLSYVSIYVV